MGRARKKRQAKIKYIKISLFIVVLLITITIIGRTIARYRSAGQSQASVDVAFYLLKDETISQEISLSSILPRSTPYTYTFSVANNDGTNRTETAIEYSVELITTTNLPLNYRVYKQGATSTNLIESTNNTPDSDGTYFKHMTLTGDEFGFEQNQQNVYVIEVEFPEQYNSADYEGRVEYLAIKVDSNQKIDNN